MTTSYQWSSPEIFISFSMVTTCKSHCTSSPIVNYDLDLNGFAHFPYR